MTRMKRTITDLRPLAKLAQRGWVSVPGVAKLAGVSPQVIREAISAGRLRAIRVGGHYRIYEDELERFLKEGNYVGEHTVQALEDMQR